MRLAWIVYGDLAQPTGGYVYDRLVVEGLRTRGDRVDVVDPVDPRLVAEASEGADALVGDGLCVRELGPLFEGAPRSTARVLLVHHFPSWEVERTDWHALRALEARAVRASDLLVATSTTTRDRLACDHPGTATEVVVPGADWLPRHARAPSPDARVELLFVGSLVARKRVTLLLDALEHLAEPGLSLTLLGDSQREPEHARAMVDRIEASTVLRSCVTIAGVAGDEALARWLARADALVLPSSLEGYGMVLTEALHAGLPVIAARPAARAAGIADLGAVRVFDDADNLAPLLRQFAHDPALRTAMRREADALVLPGWVESIAAFRRSIGGARRRP